MGVTTAAVVCGVACVGLLSAEYAGWRPGVWVFKIAAASAVPIAVPTAAVAVDAHYPPRR